MATKGDYEVLRMCKVGEPHPLIVHKKSLAPEHVTIWGVSYDMYNLWRKSLGKGRAW